MFRRRDIPPVLLLVLLIILVMLTLSQILVVHNGRYGRNIHSIRRLQMELKEMDVNLQSMMLQNVPSIELNRRLLQNEINSRRVADIMHEASLPDPRFLPSSSMAGGRHGNPTSDVAPSSHPSSTSVMTSSIQAVNSNLTSSSSSFSIGENSTGSSVNPPPSTFDWHYIRRKSFDGDEVTWSRNQSVSVPSPIVALTSLPVDSLSTDASLSGNGLLFTSSKSESTQTGSNVLELQTEAAVVGEMITTSAIRESSSTVGSNMTSRVSYCPPVPPGLRGRIFIDFEHKHDYIEEDIVRQNPGIMSGGVGRPTNCTARHKVAVIVPYRDRLTHLTELLSHLHPMLQRQQLDYRIYVVEQSGQFTFNKARIMNVAFVEALKQYAFQCFVFHDVDLVPEDDRNMYSCPVQPRHMSVAIDEMGYKLAYQELVGGVLNMRTEHFQRVNGYSNLYWGWGAEDDDMAYRIMHVGLKITRPPDAIARYKMIKHTKRKPSDWRKRTKLLYTGTRRFQFDGLNSLQYRLIHVTNTALYTHILVDIGRPPRGF